MIPSFNPGLQPFRMAFVMVLTGIPCSRDISRLLFVKLLFLKEPAQGTLHAMNISLLLAEVNERVHHPDAVVMFETSVMEQFHCRVVTLETKKNQILSSTIIAKGKVHKKIKLCLLSF